MTMLKVPIELQMKQEIDDDECVESITLTQLDGGKGFKCKATPVAGDKWKLRGFKSLVRWLHLAII